MTVKEDHVMMPEPERPTMLLFMGDREEHAITSFKHFYPSSVHIITSDRFSEKYESLIQEWSGDFGFRAGQVKSVTDLFEPSSVNSMLKASLECLADEYEARDGTPGQLFVGITGGTTHMALTGSYLTQLVGGTAFYVLRPPEGKPILPQRDILIFPEMGGAKLALRTKTPDIHYLMSNQSGSVDELKEESMMNDDYLEMASDAGLIEVKEGSWEVTELGRASYGFASSTSAWGELTFVMNNMMGSSEGDGDDVMHG